MFSIFAELWLTVTSRWHWELSNVKHRKRIRLTVHLKYGFPKYNEQGKSMELPKTEENLFIFHLMPMCTIFNTAHNTIVWSFSIGKVVQNVFLQIKLVAKLSNRFIEKLNLNGLVVGPMRSEFNVHLIWVSHASNELWPGCWIQIKWLLHCISYEIANYYPCWISLCNVHDDITYTFYKQVAWLGKKIE